MDFAQVDRFMKQADLAAEPAFDLLHFLIEPIPSDEQKRILGLYFPEGETEGKGFGYLPPSTIILPPDGDEGTLLHELGHRHGHYYYNNLTETYAENYRRAQERRLSQVYVGAYKRTKEAAMKSLVSRSEVCAVCPESVQGRSRLCMFCEYGGASVVAPLSVAQATTIVAVALTVDGNPVAAVSTNFTFKVAVTCRHPDTGATYAPAAGETKAELWENHWAILPNEKLAEVSIPAGGRMQDGTAVPIKTVLVSEERLFLIKVIHIATGKETSQKVTCEANGTYYWNWPL